MALIRPDVLVLAAGGVVGEAWMTGVLRGLTESTGIDFRTCDYYVGTSAGSIVAAALAAGRGPRAPPRRHPPHHETAGGRRPRRPPRCATPATRRPTTAAGAAARSVAPWRAAWEPWRCRSPPRPSP